jgi:hypothetical protein
VPTAPPKTLDYASRDRRKTVRTAGRAIAILVCMSVLLLASPFLANEFAASRFAGVRRGMTRAEVDRHLWAFSRQTNTTYNWGIRGGGEVVVSYRLLWFEKTGEIIVTFDADGTVSGMIPAFDN